MSRSLGADLTITRVRETTLYKVEVSWSGPPGSRVASYLVTAYGQKRGIDSSGNQVVPDSAHQQIASFDDSTIPANFRTFFNNTANPAMDAIP